MRRVVILLGPPGAGKGTQATRLSAALSLPHVATGDLFREHLAKGTDLGQRAKQYMDAGQLVPEVFSRYLDEALDLGTHVSYGRLLVAGTQERVLGFAAFYPDASAQGSGLPSGWADVRVLAVYPGTGAAAVTRALLGACERLAAEAGAPVLAIRTASFMTDAIAGYERLGYRRAPEFDGAEPVSSVAQLRYVAQMYMTLAR